MISRLTKRLLPAVLAVAILAGCKRDSSTPTRGGAPADAIAVSVAPVQSRDLPQTVEITGSLFGDEQALLSAKVAGRIAARRVDIGDRIQPGEILAKIDDTDANLLVEQRRRAVDEALARLGLTDMPPADFDPESVATVQRARLQSANARARLERARQLFEQTPPLISTQEFADLETAYQVSQQDYEVARIEARTQLALARTRAADLAAATVALRETTIVAPSLTQSPTTQPAASGELAPWAVSERLVSIGEYVQVGAPLFRIVADSPIRFRGSAPERYVGRISAGQRVQLRIEGSEAVEGVVTRVSPTIDVATRTFVIEAQIANAERRIRPGGFARASVEIGLDRDVPVVPASAVRTFAGISRVFVIDQGKAKSVAVTVRNRLGDDMLAVTGTLTPGAQVAVSGIARLSDGAAVTAQATASRE